MKFGKLDDISKVDFSLPKEPTRNSLFLNEMTEEKPLQCFIGCTAWSTKEWIGKYYPEKTKANNFLIEYGKQFNTIELNSTHYGTPKPEVLQSWYDKTPADFIFCPKIHKAISHRTLLGTDSDIIENTILKLSILKEKLGPCFLQLPPYFGADRISVLEDFLSYLPDDFDLSIEFRHESWFENDGDLDELQNLLAGYNKTMLITDVAGRRDVLHMRICNDYLLVRFVGNGLDPSDYSRINDWVERIKYYYTSGLKKVYFFSHEPDNILAPELAEYLCSKISEIEDVEVRGPQKVIDNTQLSLF